MKQSYSSAHFALRFLRGVGWIMVWLSVGTFLFTLVIHGAAAQQRSQTPLTALAVSFLSNYLLAGSGFVSGVVLLVATEVWVAVLDTAFNTGEIVKLLNRLPALREEMPGPDSNGLPDRSDLRQDAMAGASSALPIDTPSESKFSANKNLRLAPGPLQSGT
jgi:hypothetical protein